MQIVTIHESGSGADKMEIQSHGNGLAYAVHFGDATSCMRTMFFQGADATRLRDEFDMLESMEPETESRELWFRALDPHLM